MATKVARTGVRRASGWLYYLDKQGDVSRVPMARGGARPPRSRPQKVAKAGVKREDGSASGYPLEVGRDELFPQLGEALVGGRLGGVSEFEMTYPEDHSDPSLAGKTAQFKVTVREARRRKLPELDDDLAKRVSDLETLAALRARIRENLEARSRNFMSWICFLILQLPGFTSDTSKVIPLRILFPAIKE